MLRFVLIDLLEFGFRNAGVVVGSRAVVFDQFEQIVAPDRCGVEPFVEPIQKVHPVVDIADVPERPFKQVHSFVIIGSAVSAVEDLGPDSEQTEHLPLGIDKLPDETDVQRGCRPIKGDISLSDVVVGLPIFCLQYWRGAEQVPYLVDSPLASADLIYAVTFASFPDCQLTLQIWLRVLGYRNRPVDSRYRPMLTQVVRWSFPTTPAALR